MSYYRDQLDRVGTESQYKPTFKVSSINGDTNWMDLNKEAVKDLREWLDECYPPEDKNLMTLEEFNQLIDGEIFATGLSPNSPEGIFMTDIHQGDDLRWIAIKGYGFDWAIYCYWETASIEYIKSQGQKVASKQNIQKCVPCSEEVFNLYRM